MPLTLASLSLPEDLLWSDEYTGHDLVAQARTVTLGGALLIEESVQLAGRPITLGSLDERSGWITKAQLDALHALASTPGASHALTLPDGRSFTVAFRRPAFEAQPIVGYRAPGSTDVYAVRIHLLEI